MRADFLNRTKKVKFRQLHLREVKRKERKKKSPKKVKNQEDRRLIAE